MKLRIQSNSIRFRITPTELHTLATRGSVQSSVRLGALPDDRLTYSLETSSRFSCLLAEYLNCKIRVILPEDQVRDWASTAQVGLEGFQLVAGGERLRILVEKDFKCLEPRPEENEVDRFPNPAEVTKA